MSTNGNISKPRQTGKPAAAARQDVRGASKPAKGRGGFNTGMPVATHHDEAVATTMARNAMSRERYEFQLRALYVSLVLLGISMTANIFMGIRQPEYVYYALSSDGKLTPVTPLENPIQSKEQVLSWTADSLAIAFSLSFGNYQQQLSDARYLFTESGWAGFQEALARNGMLETIIGQKLVTSAVPSGAPVIVASGVVEDGRYAWRIEMPMVITYNSASSQSSDNILLEAVIQRVGETENPRGLAIGQIIAR